MSDIVMPPEAYTRTLINTSLKNLGWQLEGTQRNVYPELPRTIQEHELLDGKRPDYVLYSKEIGYRPLIIIEAKRMGARLDSALEQGINYAHILKAPIVFATDGVFCKSFHTVAQRPLILNGEEVNELIRETLALRFLTTHEVNTVSPKVRYDRMELIKIFDQANNILRGEGLRAGIERFGEFANILFLKLIDENEQVKKERDIASNFDMACSWKAIKNVPSSARIEYINDTVYRRLNILYKTDIFTPLQIKDVSILDDIMYKLDTLTLTDIDSDVKGDAFEYFLRSTTSTQNDLGEYFTPRHIVKTMVRLVNPRIGEKIYDPFCGTGGFLIEAFRYIYNNMPQNETTIEMLRNSTIYGNEITNTARITKMNMILAGDGHSNIHMKDSLAEPVDGKYDVVITNMPYSQPTKYGAYYDIPSRNGDSICVQHCIKAINSASKDGRIAIVVPEGFLFRKDLAKVREYLLRKCQLSSIISLPQGVFLPYTGVKTDIIYAVKVNQNRRISEDKKYFWYFDVKNDGYSLNNQRRKLNTPSDLARFEEFQRLDEEQYDDMLVAGFEVVPFDRVRENDFILAGNRYRQQKAISSKYDTVSIGDVVTLVNGYTFPLDMQGQQGTIPFYKISDMNTDGNEIEMFVSNNYISEDIAKIKKWETFPPDTVIFPKCGAAIGTNKKRILSVPALFNSNIMGMICGDNILPKYLLLLLSSIDIMQWASLSNPPTIKKEVVAEYKIPVPPLEIQQSIVAELEGYQNIISGAREILKSYIPVIHNTLGEYKALEEIASFRPSKSEVRHLTGDTAVSFVPMSNLNTFDVSFETVEERRLEDVMNGYTYFKDNDILMAKITPCFENGKAGIARNLKNGIGFGSTEFIVIRANTEIVYPEWIFYHINTRRFLDEGRNYMTGTAGQRRVCMDYLKQYRIPVPSLGEQKKILDAIQHEQSLIEPSRQLIKIFTDKIEARIKELWEQ